MRITVSHCPRSRVASPLAGFVLLAALASVGRAQTTVAQRSEGAAPSSDSAILAAETYVRPPAVIERLVTAPRDNNVTLASGTQSPNHRWFFKLVSAGMPSVQTFGKPHYYLGELQVDYQANRSRALTDRGAAKLEVIDGLTGAVHAIDTPQGATISSAEWSPDGYRACPSAFRSRRSRSRTWSRSPRDRGMAPALLPRLLR